MNAADTSGQGPLRIWTREGLIGALGSPVQETAGRSISAREVSLQRSMHWDCFGVRKAAGEFRKSLLSGLADMRATGSDPKTVESIMAALDASSGVEYHLMCCAIETTENPGTDQWILNFPCLKHRGLRNGKQTSGDT